MTAAPGTAGQLARLYGIPVNPLYGSEGAGVYDLLAQQDSDEIGDVLRLAQKNSGSVLELACGSGRLTMPLLARGHDILALDNSPSLLEILKGRLPGGRGRARVVEGDMTSFGFDELFSLIVLGSSSVCLLGARQRARTFALVRQHLAPGGAFFVSTMDFQDSLVAGTRAVERVTMVVGDGSMTTLFQHFEGRRGKRTTSLFHETVTEGVPSSRSMFASDVNIVSSAELAAEVEAVGLEVVSTRRGKPGEQVPVQLHCRLRGDAGE